MEEIIAKVESVLIENRIFTVRGKQVMIDRDLAELYDVSTKRINEQVKRNIQRFPVAFCFQLNDNERIELVANCDRFKNLKHSSSLPYVFTEQGVAMLSAVLRSETAINVSIRIMEAFVEMRKLIAENSLMFNRLEKLEKSQLQNEQKFDQLFKALESGSIKSEKGIFYEGQVFDAYKFISDLVRKAEKSIILIDNYIDDSILTLFAKRSLNVTLKIYTKQISKQFKLDVEKFSAQYGNVEIVEFALSHDRFLIIDENELYHIGASLKDAGKKWFAFSKMNTEILPLLTKIQENI
ncbi:MAG: ORF6N domain-containing protein [Paludibacter sp.]|nr:ORF6N domain-containing protein [Paludibacter sp.]